MLALRYFHTATLLTNGQVLVVGGKDPPTQEPLASAELYDPATGAWSATGSLSTARYSHSASLLPNGMVLVVGGWNHGLGYLSSAELYDPVTGIWRTTGSLIKARYEHTSTLLPGGKVLVVGGYSPASGGLASAELFDLSTETWAETAASISRRDRHTATLLADGTVLVVAGDLGVWLNSAELYSPLTGTWTHAGQLADARNSHTATLLPSGQVLVVGGAGVRSNTVGWLASTELYDPNLKQWSAASMMDYPRAGHAATLLRSGKLLVVGGSGEGPVAFSSALLYDPSDGKWKETRAMSIARIGHTATLLSSGKVLVAGGPTSTSTELYDEANDSVASPILIGACMLINGSFQFTFTNSPGAPFSVQASADLGPWLTNWATLGSATEIAPWVFQFTDAHATGAEHRFYRVSSP